MGAYLSQPKTEKYSGEGENPKIRFGASAMQGWRSGMEDAHAAILDFDDDASFFGVYDGHGGKEVALFCGKHLHEELKKSDAYSNGNYGQALISAYLRMDELMVMDEYQEELKSFVSNLKSQGTEENEDDFAPAKIKRTLTTLLASRESNCQIILEDSDLDTEAIDHEQQALMDKAGKPRERSSRVGSESRAKAREESGDMDFEYDKATHSLPRDTNTKERNTRNEIGADLEEDGDEDYDPDEDTEETEEADEESNENESNMEKESKGSSDEDDSGDDEDDDEEVNEGGFFSKTFTFKGPQAGCTAVVALIKSNKLYVGNAGDSRCVLSRNGQALSLSEDHKPELEEERERIVKAGGFISDGRVNGCLNLSRAIGDMEYKQNKDLSPPFQAITAYPDIRIVELDERDEFLILACDGIWDVLTIQEAVDFVRLRIHTKPLSKICEEMMDYCIAPDTNGSGVGLDNMSIILVQFNKNHHHHHDGIIPHGHQ